MIVLRRILFYVFLAIYLFLCPYLIMNTLGLQYRPKEQILERTGIIYITTVPAGADIYLNSHLFPEKTPAIISNLRSPSYRVRAVLAGYRPWEKIIPIRIGKATVAENILLIPDAWPPQVLNQNPVKEIIPLMDVPFVLIRTGPQLKDLRMFRKPASPPAERPEETAAEPTETSFPVAADDTLFAQTVIKTIYTIPMSPVLVVFGHINDQDVYLWIMLKNTVKVIDITELFTSRPDDIIWSPTDPNILFVLQDGLVNRLDVDKSAIYPQILTGVESLDIYKNNLFAITRDRSLIRWQGPHAKPEHMLHDARLREEPFTNYRDLQLHVYGEDIFVFLSESGALLSNYLPHLFMENDVKGCTFNKTGHQLLFWTGEDIGILDFSEQPESGEKAFEMIPPLTWLTLKQEDIQRAEWINDGAQILWQTDHAVYLTDTVSFGQPRVEKLVDIAKNSRIDYSDRSGELFYLDAERRLNVIKILPEGPRLPLPQLDLEFTQPEQEGNGNSAIQRRDIKQP